MEYRMRSKNNNNKSITKVGSKNMSIKAKLKMLWLCVNHIILYDRSQKRGRFSFIETRWKSGFDNNNVMNSTSGIFIIIKINIKAAVTYL